MREMRTAIAARLFSHEHGEPWEESTQTARWHYLELADIAIAAMDKDNIRELARTMANILDGVMPLLDREAARERSREAGKTMRKITEQNRALAAKEVVNRTFQALGIHLHDQ